jgi:hypothetical protein
VLLQRSDLLSLPNCDLPAAQVPLTPAQVQAPARAPPPLPPPHPPQTPSLLTPLSRSHDHAHAHYVHVPVPHAQVDTLLAAYTELAVKQPKCRAHKRIPLDFLPHDSLAFQNRVEAYIRSVNPQRRGWGLAAVVSYCSPAVSPPPPPFSLWHPVVLGVHLQPETGPRKCPRGFSFPLFLLCSRDGITNGLPSLFSELKPLYRIPGKVEVRSRRQQARWTSLRHPAPNPGFCPPPFPFPSPPPSSTRPDPALTCTQLDATLQVIACTRRVHVCVDGWLWPTTLQVIERVLTSYLTNVKAGTPLAWVFPAADGSSVVPTEKEPPSSLLWLLLLVSKVRPLPLRLLHVFHPRVH